MKIIFLYILGSLWCCASTSKNTVVLNEQGVKNIGLKTEQVSRSDFETSVFAFGRIEAIPHQRFALSSRIDGRVLENKLKVGSYVEKGANLILVESRQAGNPPPSIWLTAPADGTVLSVNTVLGAPVDPSQTLAEFGQLNTVYLVANVPQTIAGKIKQGTMAKVRFPIRPDHEYVATLLKFGVCPCPNPSCALGQDNSKKPEEKEEANLSTASVIFTLENPDHQLRPGMSAETTIVMEKRSNVLSVPREALQGSASNRYVYVKNAQVPNAFDRVTVQVGMSNRERIEIIDGLHDGDQVVTQAAYALNFSGNSAGLSLKEALDTAHGHEHNEDGSEKTVDSLSKENTHDHDDHAHGDHGDEHHHAVEWRELFFILTTAILSIGTIIMVVKQHSNRKRN